MEIRIFEVIAKIILTIIVVTFLFKTLQDITERVEKLEKQILTNHIGDQTT